MWELGTLSYVFPQSKKWSDLLYFAFFTRKEILSFVTVCVTIRGYEFYFGEERSYYVYFLCGVALSLPGDGWIESIFSVCRRPLISRPSWSLSGWTGSVLFVLRKLSETHSQLRIHVTAVLELFNISHDLHQQVVTQVICRGTCSLLEYFQFLQLYSYFTSLWRQILYFCTPYIYLITCVTHYLQTPCQETHY